MTGQIFFGLKHGNSETGVYTFDSVCSVLADVTIR